MITQTPRAWADRCVQDADAGRVGGATRSGSCCADRSGPDRRRRGLRWSPVVTAGAVFRAACSTRRRRGRWAWRRRSSPAVAVPEPVAELIFTDQPTVLLPASPAPLCWSDVRVAPYVAADWLAQPIPRIPPNPPTRYRTGRSHDGHRTTASSASPSEAVFDVPGRRSQVP